MDLLRTWLEESQRDHSVEVAEEAGVMAEAILHGTVSTVDQPSLWAYRHLIATRRKTPAAGVLAMGPGAGETVGMAMVAPVPAVPGVEGWEVVWEAVSEVEALAADGLTRILSRVV